MSGERRWLTTTLASPSNFDGGSAGFRFSTLNVAIDSSPGPTSRVISRTNPLSTPVSGAVR